MHCAVEQQESRPLEVPNLGRLRNPQRKSAPVRSALVVEACVQRDLGQKAAYVWVPHATSTCGQQSRPIQQVQDHTVWVVVPEA